MKVTFKKKTKIRKRHVFVHNSLSNALIFDPQKVLECL